MFSFLIVYHVQCHFDISAVVSHHSYVPTSLEAPFDGFDIRVKFSKDIFS